MNSRQLLTRATRLSASQCRTYATTTNTTPPMLLKIRRDLKAAMLAKDTSRLTVLRSLLASTLNASKTSSPITTDLQMLALLKKSISTSKASIVDFSTAKRQDLIEKEEGQIKVLEEYAGGVEVVGIEEIRRVAGSVAEEIGGAGKRVNLGNVLRGVMEGDRFGGKDVERGEVVKVIKEIEGLEK
ncbi:Yqey-like protein-domain-containing protein [Amylocarpus encephaloides]|uniref:Altered inheritance of mitochondria protein 41 n=1 Tax=Amylocarpus encephaloides TaxID=45428 RepID=A0A9P7YLL2_9HELO|nr:Yqey-like protein-domain-containing protein [Amylocarpus encephaloides]